MLKYEHVWCVPDFGEWGGLFIVIISPGAHEEEGL
jgi:hypothetical protein